MTKPKYTFLEALILAHHAGPGHRACQADTDWSKPYSRCKWDGAKGYINDEGDSLFVADNYAGHVIRPAKREVSLIEALHWAAQDESRTFELEGLTYRVRKGAPQFQGRELDWRDVTDHILWHDVCTIDEGWEEAELFVTANLPKLIGALSEAVSQYGKGGGPWNVPSDPGGWLDRARTALESAGLEPK